MSNSKDISSLELGRYLTQVREQAGIKQVELARKITWSPAVLSRIESGERPLIEDELSQILEAIGTNDAINLRKTLSRNWKELPRPPLEHPDQDLLWSAETVAQEISLLRGQPDIRQAFERRLSEYIEEIRNAANLVLKRDHQIAFIGSIGIGKSTAICRLTGLEVTTPDSPHPNPVLEAGAGGITICEVHLRSGPSYGLMIEPRNDSEIRADVNDFAEYIKAIGGGQSTSDDGEDQSLGISKEVSRAIRNMANLRVRREKGSDGKTIRHDEAKELATKFTNTRELVVDILAKMELHRRDRRDLWYDTSYGKQPLEWLKETFEKINNGRHPDFTLPRRIEVVVPKALLNTNDLSVRLIDTKGVDRTAARADLESLLNDSHTLVVLCSGFNDAPSTGTLLILERAREAGVRWLQEKAALLILPRPNEALAVKDETGERVESSEEGYDLKREQIAQSLQPLSMQALPVDFFNSFQDSPENLREFLVSRLKTTRDSFNSRLSEIVANAKILLENYEQEQSQAVLNQAGRLLNTWIEQHHKPLHLNARSHVQDSLLKELTQAYAATVRASISREGEWHNLNYWHHLGYGARRMAAQGLEGLVDEFSGICQNLAATPDFIEAKELISQAERLLRNSYDELLLKIQIMGQTSFQDALKVDKTLWSSCQSEWGRGTGYKDRVASHNREWFNKEDRLNLEAELIEIIEREWSVSLTRISSLFDTEE